MSSGILKDRLENEEVNRLGGSANLGCVDLNPNKSTRPRCCRAPAQALFWLEPDLANEDAPSKLLRGSRDERQREALRWVETLFKDNHMTVPKL